MRRFFIITTFIVLTLGSASAQKKELQSLTDEFNAFKAKEAEMIQQINSLKTDNAQLQQQIGILKTTTDNNKALGEQLKTMVAAYSSLDSSQKSTAEDIAKLTAKIDELITKLDSNSTTSNTSAKYEVVGNICNGLALVRNGLLYGYVNAKGEIVIPAQFEEARGFSEGLAAVKKGNKWGFINTSGSIVISTQFAEVSDFGEYSYNGMARAKINGKWGIINNTGNFVIPAKYDYIYYHNTAAGRKYWFAQIHDELYFIHRNRSIEKY